jgi:chromate reductase, NAD(P)H dehydrogenase (quinone)
MSSMRLLLVTGSTRRGSTNSAALHTALELVGAGTEASVYDELAGLPAFNPDDDYEPLPRSVAALRAAIAEADAVVFCTPEYAGTLPGSFKNLLDWTVGGAEMYGKPAAWINVAAPGRGTGSDATLRTVLGYVGAEMLASSGVKVPVGREAIGPDGRIEDPETRTALAGALSTIVAELSARTGSRESA